MRYFWPQFSSMAGFSSQYGVLTTPGHHAVPLGIRENRLFGVDTGLKGKLLTNDSWAVYLSHIKRLHPYLDLCQFIVVPDRIADHPTTYTLFEQLAGEIVAAADWEDAPLAYVAQDGAEDDEIPMCTSVVFIGGSSAWKLGPGARTMIRLAHAEGKAVHVGAVNSMRRYHYFNHLGCASCDGTTATYNPTQARKRLDQVIHQRSFFSYS